MVPAQDRRAVRSAPAPLEKPEWSQADVSRKRDGEGRSDASQMETGTMLLQTEGKAIVLQRGKELGELLLSWCFVEDRTCE